MAGISPRVTSFIGLSSSCCWMRLKVTSRRMPNLHLFIYFVCFLFLACSTMDPAQSAPRGGGAGAKMAGQAAVPKIPLQKQKPTCVNLKCRLWNSPADLRWKVLKMCEKHLKRRCLADVSHNASSSSDMASCLSPIHMLMLNQAGQSGSFSSHGFFFQVFPSNQFTLERDKSLKSHIRGEGSKW